MLRVAIGDDSRGDPGAAVLPFPCAAGRAVRAGRAHARLRHAAPGQHGLEIVHPSYRVLDAGEHGAGRALDPVYPARSRASARPTCAS
jgi:ATP-dependent DNA helicase RecG